ncbi:MAG: dockerin type I repeat-containing protein, partial [Clostridia bacterium]|nr:dockerin type I repeat-containing protein [Clostridia bacterium]
VSGEYPSLTIIPFFKQTSAPAFMKGDLDGDKEITVSDALIALRIAAKLLQPTEEHIAIGDTDGDGVIDVTDALAILRVAAKLVPPESLQ